MQSAKERPDIDQVIDQMKFIAESASAMVAQSEVNNSLQIESRNTLSALTDGLNKYRATLGPTVDNACSSLVTVAQTSLEESKIQAQKGKDFLDALQEKEENHERRHNDLAEKLQENTAKTAEALFTLTHSNTRIDNMAEGIKNLCAQISGLTDSIHKQQIASTEKINTLEVKLVSVSTKVDERWKGLAAVATLSIALSAAISKYVL